MEEEEAGATERRRRRRWPRALLALLLLILLVLLIVWTQRIRIADDYIDRELRRRGVQATYDVTNIGFRRQRLQNVVLGNPADPDLTADWIEIETRIGLFDPSVEKITARGVRMRARIVDGRVSLGEVDKLRPPPTDEPFRLPDLNVDLADSGVLLETPSGAVGIGISGRGNLADGFRGRVAAVSRQLDFGACRLVAPRASVAVHVERERPTIRGPLQAEEGGCGRTFEVIGPHLGLDLTLTEGFDGWNGSADMRSVAVRAGPQALAAFTGRLSFEGDGRMTRGEIDAAAAHTLTDYFRSGRTRLRGRYAFSTARGTLSFLGDSAVAGVVPRPSLLAPATGVLRGLGGTPLDPVGRALADAVERAGAAGSDVRANVTLVNGPDYGAVRFERLRGVSGSGARFGIEGAQGLTYYWPSGTLQTEGLFAVAGGGLPDARFRVRQPRPGGPVSGVGRIAPFAAGGARLELGELRFDAGPDGSTRLLTHATMSGPFGGGTVEGLSLPVDARFGAGGFVLNPACVPARFERLRLDGLALGPARLPVCPEGRGLIFRAPGGTVRGAGRIAAPRFAGTLAGTPIAIAADSLRFDIAGPDLDATNLAVDLGREPWVNRFEAAALTARFGGGGAAGRYRSLSARLAGVPLVFSDGEGAWRLRGGDLAMEGSQRVSDEADPPRFLPLVSNDFRLTLADDLIRATAGLRHPDSGTLVTEATVRHDLSTERGEAVLDVPGLTFGEGFQPDDITPLTVGVVALVDGTVTGRGRVEWGPDFTRSTGRFRTRGMNLAAPFGPVEGLTTEIEFTDLLGLVSAPGQIAEVGVVRTGIDVFDGRIRYQLLPDSHVRIEAGRWPFAGGELLLEETVLDFSQPSTHRLTFRVIGLQAPNFIQQMEFGNIAATGTFDGVIPMEFDIRGGRIVGGRLEARAPGGTLSYIGELTDRDLGTWGKLAFDALKSLRYSRLVIELDGALDGEFLTRIQLDGIARDPELAAPAGGGITGLVARRALSQLARLPFRFNVRIQGPFRALIGTARSFDDPSLLIQPVLPPELRDLPTTVSNVQRDESENEP
ncbi:MAG: YdbH domain-containing protein [Allosphingosinicella sp.]|uniref:YdbH domain-containing protein n=1 Tax=Allosphingosinicella sp. TaxID=2823234 RepID=UPI0039447B1F